MFHLVKWHLTGLSFTELNDRAAECAEQDQTACVCILILPHTHCQDKSILGMTAYG